MSKKLTRAYLDDVGFIYRTPDTPEMVDADPSYFDDLVLDLTDTNKYFDDDPMVSGMMRSFHIICGNFPEEYDWATYTIEGISRKFNKGRAPDYFLHCSRNQDWRHVGGSRPAAEPVAPEPVAEVPEKRGPGRPPKNKAA